MNCYYLKSCTFAPQIKRTMEQKFRKSDGGIDLRALREFCRKEGKVVEYRKGEQLEREGDGRDHLTWFSFEGEFVADYPCVLSGLPSLATIEAMMPCRVWRVSGEELVQFFNRSIKNMKLRADIGEHMLNQFKARYQDFHRATPHERYNQLLSRCPGIVEHLPLNAIASFLCVTPQQLSRIRKAVTFSEK